MKKISIVWGIFALLLIASSPVLAARHPETKPAIAKKSAHYKAVKNPVA
jgi:hypothetical protein